MTNLLKKLAVLADELDKIDSQEIADEIDMILKDELDWSLDLQCEYDEACKRPALYRVSWSDGSRETLMCEYDMDKLFDTYQLDPSFKQLELYPSRAARIPQKVHPYIKRWKQNNTGNEK